MSTLEERFWSKVDKSGDCWIWTKSKDTNGYGHFWANGKLRPAHRFSYELEHGPIADGMLVDHTCHNIACVNPGHLRLATAKQNAENRRGAMRGTKSGVRGVSWDSQHGRWRGQVGHAGVNYRVGLFDSIEEAEAAVVAKRNELFTHNDLDRKVVA